MPVTANIDGTYTHTYTRNKNVIRSISSLLRGVTLEDLCGVPVAQNNTMVSDVNQAISEDDPVASVEVAVLKGKSQAVKEKIYLSCLAVHSWQEKYYRANKSTFYR